MWLSPPKNASSIASRCSRLRRPSAARTKRRRCARAELSSGPGSGEGAFRPSSNGAGCLRSPADARSRSIALLRAIVSSQASGLPRPASYDPAERQTCM